MENFFLDGSPFGYLISKPVYFSCVELTFRGLFGQRNRPLGKVLAIICDWHVLYA